MCTDQTAAVVVITWICCCCLICTAIVILWEGWCIMNNSILRPYVLSVGCLLVCLFFGAFFVWNFVLNVYFSVAEWRHSPHGIGRKRTWEVPATSCGKGRKCECPRWGEERHIMFGDWIWEWAEQVQAFVMIVDSVIVIGIGIGLWLYWTKWRRFQWQL